MKRCWSQPVIAGFEIRESLAAHGEFVLVPPDIATCDALPGRFSRSRQPPLRLSVHQLHPLRPALQHHSGHPVRSPLHDHVGIPHVRRPAKPSITIPRDRRFHAQPNACPECGPWVELWDHERLLYARGEAIRETQRRLKAGRIVAIKGLGGFHLACLASQRRTQCGCCANESAVAINRSP